MIQKLKVFPNVIPRDAAAIKIYCNFTAYKEYENLYLFFEQINEKGKTTALICFGGETAVLYFNGGNTEEIKEFLCFLGAKQVFTSTDLGFLKKQECYLLHKKVQITNSAPVLNHNTPRQVLNILKSGLTVGDDNEFVSDLSHRLYNNQAGCVADDCSAGVIYLTNKFSFVSALAVLPNCRLKGKGSTALEKLIKQSKTEDVFVCCEEKNLPFYKKNGFLPLGKSAVWEM